MPYCLVGKPIRVQKPVRVALCKEDGGGFVLIPAGESILIEAVGNDKIGLLRGKWRGSKVLVFQQDLQAIG